MRTSTAQIKDALVEINNNLQGKTIPWIKLRIKSMIWNTKRQKTSNQNNKKQKESKKMRIV